MATAQDLGLLKLKRMQQLQADAVGGVIEFTPELYNEMVL
jgi:hypothetical protein